MQAGHQYVLSPRLQRRPLNSARSPHHQEPETGRDAPRRGISAGATPPPLHSPPPPSFPLSSAMSHSPGRTSPSASRHHPPLPSPRAAQANSWTSSAHQRQRAPPPPQVPPFDVQQQQHRLLELDRASTDTGFDTQPPYYSSVHVLKKAVYTYRPPKGAADCGSSVTDNGLALNPKDARRTCFQTIFKGRKVVGVLDVRQLIDAQDPDTYLSPSPFT